MKGDKAVGWSDALGEHATNPPQNRTSGTYSITALDETWPVSPIENRIKAQFETWVRNNAVNAIATMDGNQELFKEFQSTYISDRAAGKYNWPMSDSVLEAGIVIRNALRDVSGTRYMLFLLLNRACPKERGMTEELAGRIYRDSPAQVSSAIRWALGTDVIEEDERCNSESSEISGSTKENDEEAA